MITEFVTKFDSARETLLNHYKVSHPTSYLNIVKDVFCIINPDGDYGLPDPEIIHEIDDGDYQGTKLYIVPEKTYQPDKYWSVFVNYGSCSGCDTLEAITNYSSEQPTEEQAKQYLTLALHVVQSIREIPND